MGERKRSKINKNSQQLKINICVTEKYKKNRRQRLKHIIIRFSWSKSLLLFIGSSIPSDLIQKQNIKPGPKGWLVGHRLRLLVHSRESINKNCANQYELCFNAWKTLNEFIPLFHLLTAHCVGIGQSEQHIIIIHFSCLVVTSQCTTSSAFSTWNCS